MSVASTRPGIDIVSVDSMQVYRGMDIGTAKPTTGERRAVHHHLIDLVDVVEEFTVSAYLDALTPCLESISSAGRSVLFVGGTGLYLRAVVDGLDLAGVWPEIRERLEEEADRVGVPILHERLALVDPEAARKIDPDNRRRVIRALEVIEGSGAAFSSRGQGLDRYPETEVIQVGLRWERAVLGERIAERVHAMVEHGLVAEVERVLSAGPSKTARQALGYREIIDHLNGRCSLEVAIEDTIRRTRQFAVRQERWFRRDPRITWVDISADPVAEAGPVVAGLLP